MRGWGRKVKNRAEDGDVGAVFNWGWGEIRTGFSNEVTFRDLNEMRE